MPIFARILPQEKNQISRQHYADKMPHSPTNVGIIAFLQLNYITGDGEAHRPVGLGNLWSLPQMSLQGLVMFMLYL